MCTFQEGIVGIRHDLELLGRGVMSDKAIARRIANTIYDIRPGIFSGLVSTSLINEDGFRVGKVCQDHRVGRQRAGHFFIKMHREGILTDALFESFLREAMTVNYVSSKENNMLIPLQQILDGDYKQDPVKIGMVLVPDPGAPPSWFYKKYRIEGKTYTSIKLAAQALDLSYDEIRKRCASGAKKWSSWKRG